MTKFVICATYCGNQLGCFYFTKEAFQNEHLDAIDCFDENIDNAQRFDTREDAEKVVIDRCFEDVEIFRVGGDEE